MTCNHPLWVRFPPSAIIFKGDEMKIEQQKLDYYRFVADRDHNKNLLDKLNLELQDYDREKNKLLRKYGEFDEEFGVYMIDESYPTYEMFLEEKTILDKKTIEIKNELYKECEREISN